MITFLHALHRTSYMGERALYATRRLQALNFPQDCISIISDGMAQNHCQLPWLGKKRTIIFLNNDLTITFKVAYQRSVHPSLRNICRECLAMVGI